MDWFEAAELAAVVLGIDPNTLDDNLGAVDQGLYDHLGISLETFQQVAELLLPLTPEVQTALSGQLAQGFIKDGYFIVKQYVEPVQP